MTSTTAEGSNRELQRLQILCRFKQCYGRANGNVSPFREDRVCRYHTAVHHHDVPDIHRRVRDRITQSIRSLHEGQSPGVVVLAGQPGMGKSHLINHFRHPEVQSELGCFLVCNSNHWNVGEFEKCLLGWILDALIYPSPSEPHPLLDKLREVAYLALGQILRDREQTYHFLFRSPRNSLGRLWHRLAGSGLDKVVRMAEARDDRVFRELDFNRFASYVCDRFLAERNKVFHRYVLRVLLRYLFPDERELVLHWLRGAQVGDHFLKVVGVQEDVDTSHERMEIVKILIALYSRDVAAGLAGSEPNRACGKAFVFAFDQVEGRDELFDREEDWHTFFAQVSELYNDLPNVLILFTMTTSMRDVLFPRIEAQFQDRVRRDPDFVLYEIADPEVLALYRRRVDHWLGDRIELRRELEQFGNPYLPFDQSTVQGMARNRTLRGILDEFDRAFSDYLENQVSTGPRFDYLVFKNSIRESEEERLSEFDYTASHLQTLESLLNGLGGPLLRAYALVVHQTGWLKTQDGLPVLQIEFHDPADPRRWVLVYVICLPRIYNARIDNCATLLFRKWRHRHQLWLLRPNRLEVDENALREGYTIRARVLPTAVETMCRAILRVHNKQTEQTYGASLWDREFPDLLEEINQQTYLGELFDGVRQMMQGPQEPPPDLPVSDPSMDTAEGNAVNLVHEPAPAKE